MHTILKGFIFDMDGVIINSEPAHRKAERLAMETCGVFLNESDLERSVGRTEAENFEHWIQEYRLSVSVDQLRKTKAEFFIPMLKNDVTLIDGITELLAFIQKKGIKIGLATSSYQDRVDIVFSRFNLAPFFQTVVTASDVRYGKPDPEIYLKAAEKLGLPPAECWVLEDAAAGVQSAKAAGMTAVAFKSPFTLPQHFEKADHEAGSLKDVQTLLEKQIQATK